MRASEKPQYLRGSYLEKSCNRRMQINAGEPTEIAQPAIMALGMG